MGLARLVDSAISGSGGLALITGDAGIGKTALAVETARYAAEHGATVVWGVCVAGIGVPPYWPWPSVMNELRAQPLPTAGTADGDNGWFTAGTAIVAAIHAAAAVSPVVVVLDDLQWAGAGCIRLLDFAARQLRRAPVLFLGTYRDVEVDSHHPLSPLISGAEVLTLAGLGAAGVASMLRPAVGGRADVVAARVTERTGGNPFFVQQIGRLLPPAETASITDIPVPAGVGEAVNRRIARLPEPTTRLLDVASVGGIDVDAALLAAATSTSYAEVEFRLEPAVLARVLRPTGLGRYRFEHDLYRETRYERLNPTVRARMHRAIADALMDRRSAGADVRMGDIAHHYARAVPAVAPEAALTHVRAAAVDAEAHREHEEAARYWAQAIRLAEVAGAVPPAMRLALADALLRAGEVAAARATYLAVATGVASDPVRLGRAALGVHRCGTASGVSHTQTIDLLDRACAAFRGRTDDEPALAARVHAALAREIADGPDADDERARILAAEAVALAESPAGRPALAFCLLAQHDVEWGPGTAANRVAIAAEMAAAAIAWGTNDLECEALLCRFVALVELADPLAVAALRDVETCAERLGQPHYRYLALSRRAAFSIGTGDIATGQRQIAEALELGEAIGEPDASAVHVTQSMMLALLRGGASGLGLAARAFGDSALPPELAPHERAVRQLADGYGQAAAATLRAAVDARIASMFRWRMLAEAALAIEIAIAAGTPDVCEIKYRKLLAYAGEFIVIGGVVSILGPVDLYLGLAAGATHETAAAERHFTDAATLADRLGAPAFAARARIELAHVLHAVGDETAARRLARHAAAVADELGLDVVRDRAAALLTLKHRPTAALRRTDKVWTLTFDGRSAQLPDAKGLHDLAALLAVPGQEISALQLVGAAEPDTGADELLDQKARAAYKSRLMELESEIDSADERGDARRGDRLRIERQALIAELAHASGLGSRVRRLGDLGERARSTVTARIRYALRRIDDVHPDMAAHLRASVTTGHSCAYRPERPVHWHVEPHGL
jgi:hypothetical protein